MLVFGAYTMLVNQFKSCKVLDVLGSIVVGGAQAYCALLHFVCDLKAIQINVQCSLIR